MTTIAGNHKITGMNQFSFLTAKARKLREAAQKLEEAAKILKEFGSDSVSEPTPEERTDELEIDKPRTGTALIVEIMQIFGKPISKQTILDMAQRQDAKMKSIATISSYLSRDDRFMPFGGGEWGLAEWEKESDQSVVNPNEKEAGSF